MTFWLLVLILIVWLRLEGTRSRLSETRSMAWDQRGLRRDVEEVRETVKSIAARVGLLEQRGHPAPAAAATPSPEAVTGQISPPSPKSHIPEDALPTPPIRVAPDAAHAAPVPRVMPPPIPQPLPPQPAENADARQDVPKAARDWEALIGGNLLNKVGALILVIGIALFLSYSLTRLGALGRVLTGASAGAVLLASGVWGERKNNFRLFSGGLIAAGWASLYFTSYAMYELDAARVIDDPFAGVILMLVVAGGMVGHSLRYRSQALTALAYGCAFGALALSELSTYAVMALIPLAVSVLYLARRFEWPELALFGAIATYGTFLTRPDQGASLYSVEGMLLAFWVMFEAFDLWRIALRQRGQWKHHLLFAVNACAGLGAAAAIWYRKSPETLWEFCAAGAALYLASTLLRIWLDAQSRYEAALAISAFLGALGIFAQVDGVWTSLALLLEAEILFLAGHYYRVRLARWCSLAAFAWSLIVMALRPGIADVMGMTFDVWAVPLMIAAVVFYANRAMDKDATYFSYLGTACLTILIGKEAAWRYAGGIGLSFAVILFVTGYRKRLDDIRTQSYIVAMLGTAAVGTSFLDPLYVWHSWIHAAAALVALGCGILAETSLRDLPEQERRFLRFAGSLAVGLLTLLFVNRAVPDREMGVTLLGVSVLLLELAIRRLPRELWMSAIAVNLAGAASVAMINVGAIERSLAPAVWSPFAGGFAVYTWLAIRTLRAFRTMDVALRRCSLVGAALLASVAFWIVVPDPYVPLAMGALALICMETGLALDAEDFTIAGRVYSFFAVEALSMTRTDSRILVPGTTLAVIHWYQWARIRGRAFSYAHGWLAAALASWTVATEFPDHTLLGWGLIGAGLVAAGRMRGNEHLRWQSATLAIAAFAVDLIGGHPGWHTVVVVGWYLTALSLQPREHGGWAIRAGYSVMAAILTAATLYRDISGGVLTLSWGVEGIALLAVGFALRERMLRLSGLALLLVCILKVFLYDLRNLDTLYRILSFIGLGVILLGVSWIYTRFKDTIQRYL